MTITIAVMALDGVPIEPVEALPDQSGLFRIADQALGGRLGALRVVDNGAGQGRVAHGDVLHELRDGDELLRWSGRREPEARCAVQQHRGWLLSVTQLEAERPRVLGAVEHRHRIGRAKQRRGSAEALPPLGRVTVGGLPGMVGELDRDAVLLDEPIEAIDEPSDIASAVLFAGYEPRHGVRAEET